jgi:hypothetical protein
VAAETAEVRQGGRRLGDHRQVCKVVGNLGAVAKQAGDLVRTRTALAESLAVGGVPSDRHAVSDERDQNAPQLVWGGPRNDPYFRHEARRASTGSETTNAPIPSGQVLRFR